MASPFAPFANATLDFQVANGELETDSLGNVHPGTATQQVVALLKHNNKKRDSIDPGKDLNRHYYEGFVVAPLPLSNLITPDCPCSATIDGITGRFHLEFTQINPYTAALNIHLVDRIKGWFVPDSYVAFVAISGSGNLALVGSGEVIPVADPISGSGLIALTGAGTIEDTTTLFSGTNSISFSGSGTVVETTIGFSGSETLGLTGSGSITSQFSGSGLLAVDGSGTIEEAIEGQNVWVTPSGGYWHTPSGGYWDVPVNNVSGSEILNLTGAGTIEEVIEDVFLTPSGGYWLTPSSGYWKTPSAV